MNRALECESAVELMAVLGGSFVRSLIVTYQLADDHNKARLKAAFAPEFQRYQDIYEDIKNQSAIREVAV
jgi:hypothetical protein